MALIRTILFSVLLFLCTIDSNVARRPSKIFNVVNYGAIADGKTDNSKAFLRAWKDGCAHDGKSRIIIPRGIFMLESVSFEGYCNGSMSFVIRGTLKAPTNPSKFGTNTWIGFRYVNELTVNGRGSLDGQGHAAWPYNDCSKNPNCSPLPVTLRFDFVTNSRVNHLRSIDSKNAHINLFACYNMTIRHLRLQAPADSPNTDGIHIGSSSHIDISRSVISTGDDCVAMVSGSRDIDISGVTCGPGHGISIGSLGRFVQREDVGRIRVRNCSFIGTQNGVRIKTWAPSLRSVASDMSFEDIVMDNVQNPIVIDQHYCPRPPCDVKRVWSSAVEIKNVTFSNIRGTSSSEIAVNMDCSKTTPCKNVDLTNINLGLSGGSRKKTGTITSFCSNAFGSSHGVQHPPSCIP